MKKLLFVLFALCMIASPVFAQTETETVQYDYVGNWDDVVEDFVAKGFGGSIYDFKKLGFSIMIPNGLEQTALSEEEMEQGHIVDAFMNEDLKQQVVVTFTHLGLEFLDDVRDAVEANIQGAECWWANYNGLDMLLFSNPAALSATSVISAGDGYYVQVTVSELDDEYMSQMVNFIFASIRPLAEE